MTEENLFALLCDSALCRWVWLQDAVEVCKAFMERDPLEFRFTIITLSKDSFE